MTRNRTLSVTVLGMLAAMIVLAVLVSPGQTDATPYSSFSPTVSGLRLGRDLLRSLGWRTEARTVQFDGLGTPAPIQVVVNADLTAAEGHALLDFVRKGGALLVAGNAGALDDSLPTTPWASGEPAPAEFSADCDPANILQDQVLQFGRLRAIRWREPAPVDTVGFGMVKREAGRGSRERLASGYPFGRGRIVHVADANAIVNDLVRRCTYEADVNLVRMIEYLARDQRGLRIAFDEYHHGYGVRGGSFTAIRMYLGGTPSGRMLAQMGVAGLLLLFAAAPRPLAPRDPIRVQRRSPLEHAEALAIAYRSVTATRTATSRLLAGLRRRVRRDRSRGRQTDAGFLASAAALSPAASAAAATVSSALDRQVTDRELPGIVVALETIEQSLTRRPPSAPR